MEKKRENQEKKIKDMLPGDSIQIARKYMDSLLIEGRVIGAGYPSSETDLFGMHFATPIMTAALSHLDLVSMAKGAMQAGAAVCIGMGDEAELKSVLETGARTIKLIKPYADEDAIFSRIAAAEKYGAMAVGMDAEHAACVESAEDSMVCGYPMKQKSLAELKNYVVSTRLPFIMKGVLSVRDAVRCEGIILSHHNGLMRYAVPPVMVLPEIRRAVGDALTIIVDGGISSGFDAFKALALGADAVSVGRALIPALKERGEDGVRETIRRMNDELKAAMLRTDSKNVKSIDPSVIRRM